MLLFVENVKQRNHRITTQIQRRIYGHATDVEIRPLDEEKAVQAAVDLIGELFIFAVPFSLSLSLSLEFILLCYSGTNRLYMSRWVEALLFLRFREVHAQKLEKRKHVSRN